MLQQLIHNGIIIPELPAYHGLVIRVRGQPIQLTPQQEEMALAWARKQGTPYVRDPVFGRNFMGDFSAALGLTPPLSIDQVDFASAIRIVQAERAAKEAMTPEERKAAAAIRKAIRAELKEKYGQATVNGERVELGGYLAEPSSIFMGRGQHPLRGRWKEGAKQQDITLNLSPDAPRPEGNWKEIVWQPESLWIARWEDKLSAKLKYVWLSDTAPMKQSREAAKFDKATVLHKKLKEIRKQIQGGLQDQHPRRRMVAMACYLIDNLCMRVGDEKDEDEADTVGATTLRPEHVTLHPDGRAEFNFLGKDSVEWHKELELPPLVFKTLQELIQEARPSGGAGGVTDSVGESTGATTRDLPQLFPDIGSRDVNAFLSKIQKGLSAKVFRTHHATQAVTESLKASNVRKSDPEYKKWRAAVMANLAAAVLCNHTKQASGDWEGRQQRFQERHDKAAARLQQTIAQQQAYEKALAALQSEAEAKEAAETDEEHRVKIKARYEKKLAAAQKRVETARQQVERADAALGKIDAQMAVAAQGRSWNLSTSIKSYIDPRVYHQWGKKVGYDVISAYYPTTLRRKFAWVNGERTDHERRQENE